MQTMNISIPDQLKEYVDEQMAQGRYSSVSEYMRELIRADERRKKAAEFPTIIDPDDYHFLSEEERKKEEDKLEALLLEGLEGEPSPMTQADWDDIKARGIERYNERMKGRNAGR
jgi:antitoxin ParD1/3/4